MKLSEWLGAKCGTLLGISVTIGVLYFVGALWSVLFGTWEGAIERFKVAGLLVVVPLLFCLAMYAVLLFAKRRARNDHPYRAMEASRGQDGREGNRLGAGRPADAGPTGEERQWSGGHAKGLDVDHAELRQSVEERFDRYARQDPMQKAAEALVAASRGNAASMFVPVLDRFPILQGTDLQHWDFILTVAGVFMAASRLNNLAVGDAREEKLMEIVAESLEKWDPDGIRVFEDCKRYYEQQYGLLAAAGHDPEFLASDSVGRWIVWNVLGRVPHSKDEVMLVRATGAMVTHGFFDWWTTQDVRPNGGTACEKDTPVTGERAVATMQELADLFGGSLKMGIGYSEETYAKAKPHFQAAFREFVAAGKSLKDFIRWAVTSFGSDIRPYLQQYRKDVAAARQEKPMDAIKEAKKQRHEPTMALMAKELIRVEAMFQQCPPTHPERPALTRALTAFYAQLNRMTAAAAMTMGYSLHQWEWPDSKPLEVTAQAVPELALEPTEWYQYQLGMMIMPSADRRHPWWNLEIQHEAIMTSATSPQSS